MREWRSTRAGNIHTMQIGALHCSIMGPHQWDDAEWDEFLDTAPQDPPLPKLSIAVHMVPLHVTARQRRAAAERTNGGSLQAIAMLTDSGLLRGVLTAFGWMVSGPKIKAFPPDEIAPALAWLAQTAAFDVAAAETELQGRVAHLESLMTRSARAR